MTGQSWKPAEARGFVTRLLDGNTQHRLPGADVDWDAVLALDPAIELWPWFWHAAKEQDLLGPLPPSLRQVLSRSGNARNHVAAVLETSWIDNQRRTVDLLNQLEAVVVAFAAANIAVVALKGAALQVLAVFPDPACRTMRDLDLLVRVEDAERAEQILHTMGYSEPIPDADWTEGPWYHHRRPLRDPRRFGSVELHTRPVDTAWSEVLPVALLWDEAVQYQWRGHTVLVPPSHLLVVHALVHGFEANEHRRHFQFDLRMALDIRRIGPLSHAETKQVQRCLDSGGLSELVSLHDTLVHHFFDGVVSRSSIRSRTWLKTALFLETRPAVRIRFMQAINAAPVWNRGRLRRFYGPGSGRELRTRHYLSLVRRGLSKRPR